MKVQFTPEEIEMLNEFIKSGINSNTSEPDFTDPYKHYCCHTSDINFCLHCDYRSECTEILQDKDAAEFIKENEELDKLDNAYIKLVHSMYFRGRITNDKKIISKFIGFKIEDITSITYLPNSDITCVTYSMPHNN